jgi:hypothetical protein
VNEKTKKKFLITNSLDEVCKELGWNKDEVEEVRFSGNKIDEDVCAILFSNRSWMGASVTTVLPWYLFQFFFSAAELLNSCTNMKKQATLSFMS